MMSIAVNLFGAASSCAEFGQQVDKSVDVKLRSLARNNFGFVIDLVENLKKIPEKQYKFLL